MSGSIKGRFFVGGGRRGGFVRGRRAVVVGRNLGGGSGKA